MKKLFPIIILLISLSLGGLMYIQYSWYESAEKEKANLLRENISLAVFEAADRLMQSTAAYSEKELQAARALQDEEMKLAILKPLVIQRYTKDQIRAVLRESMKKYHLEGISVEFAVFQNGSDNSIQSEQFRMLYDDSVRNTRFVAPLESPNNPIVQSLPTPPEFLMVFVPGQEDIVMREISTILITTILFTLIILAAFLITVIALLRQKKLSEIKSDFINNMTHEFKTPLATISLAVDSLGNEKVRQSPDKAQFFIQIIKEENQRMNKQVETILQASLLERSELKLNLHLTSAHALIATVINKIQLQVEKKGGQIEVSFQANHDKILADNVHFTNIINNLLDNAIKYSKEEGMQITVSTQNKGKKLEIMIADNGIGMSRDTQKRIFEKFYRAHTGNIHNVKGFGLGLSYVKSIIEAHKGTIRVDSKPGQGSTFILSLPTA
ncbi:MAG: sensor histidine kinase [Ferruginibacter sp.]